MKERSTVRLELEADEALLLFEFLMREIQNEGGERLRRLSETDGELWALNSLHCLLERVLVEPFRTDYDELLARADANIQKQLGPWPK